jgi:hypothetical protein
MRKFLERILPDDRLNAIGRRYNVFCMAFLAPYLAVIWVMVFAHLFGWKAPGDWLFLFQFGWVLLWGPNLFLIGVRSDRDFRASAALNQRMYEADRDFFRAHAARMAWMNGEGPPPVTPPTVN